MRKKPGGEIEELSEVRLRRACTDEGIEVAAGSRGTVVAVYTGGRAYEVEFEGNVVLTVMTEDLEPLDGSIESEAAAEVEPMGSVPSLEGEAG